MKLDELTATSFTVRRTLLVGGDGVPVDAFFLAKTFSHWLTTN
jgi:hypothetical protein